MTERVLRAVEQVPAGSIVSYGDLAELVGTGPRQVGAIMAEWGATVSWWRVTNHQGQLPERLLAEAAQYWRAEGIPLARNGRGVAIARCRADLSQLAIAYESVSADLPPQRGAGPQP